MAVYGIRVLSSSDTLQIDSSLPLSYFKVTQSGFGNSVLTPNLTDIVLIRPNAGSNTTTWGLQTTGSPGVGGYTRSFWANETQTNTNYLVLRPSSTGSPTAGYGIRVYNTDGQIAFDSGNFITGTSGERTPQVISIINRNTVYGDPTLSPQSIVYTGADYLQVYVAVNNSINTALGIKINCFVWNTTTSSIRFRSYFTFLASSVTYYNQSSILLVKLV